MDDYTKYEILKILKGRKNSLLEQIEEDNNIELLKLLENYCNVIEDIEKIHV